MTFDLAVVTLKSYSFCDLKSCPGYISESVCCNKLILGRGIALLPCDICVMYNEIDNQSINFKLFFS